MPETTRPKYKPTHCLICGWINQVDENVCFCHCADADFLGKDEEGHCVYWKPCPEDEDGRRCDCCDHWRVRDPLTVFGFCPCRDQWTRGVQYCGDWTPREAPDA